VGRKHAQKLRRLVIIALLIAILGTGLTPMVGMSALSVIACLFAAVVERWLFFAEAQHVVSLYYGAERA